jgi:hypothetical protein
MITAISIGAGALLGLYLSALVLLHVRNLNRGHR